jgi:hypothetical protein
VQGPSTGELKTHGALTGARKGESMHNALDTRYIYAIQQVYPGTRSVHSQRIAPLLLIMPLSTAITELFAASTSVGWATMPLAPTGTHRPDRLAPWRFQEGAARVTLGLFRLLPCVRGSLSICFVVYLKGMSPLLYRPAAAFAASQAGGVSAPRRWLAERPVLQQRGEPPAPPPAARACQYRVFMKIRFASRGKRSRIPP